jgi:hypothetical protein
VEKKVKVRCGAIIREIPIGALEWYLAAKWKVVEDDKTDSKKTTSE